MSAHVDELAERRRRKSGLAALLDAMESAMRGALMEAYQPDHPDSVRRRAARAAYDREMAVWDADLRLMYRERDRWADDGGREP